MFPIIAAMVMMAALVQAVPNGCGPSLKVGQVLNIAPNASCNTTLDEGILIFEVLELQPGDDLTIMVGDNSTSHPIRNDVLPAVQVPANASLHLDLKGPDYRRLKARLVKSCELTLEAKDPSKVLRIPYPISLSEDAVTCTVSLNAKNDLKLSVSVSQLQLTSNHSSLTIVHNDGSSDTIRDNDRCDYIEESGAKLEMVVSQLDAILLQAEPVIASCSSEANLAENSTLNLNLTVPTEHNGLECRLVAHYHGKKSLVGQLSLSSTNAASYLQVHNGGQKSSPTLFLQGPSNIQGGYFVTKAESLLVRYGNVSGELSITATESADYLSKPGNFSVGENSVYLLEQPGKVVVLQAAQLQGPLKLFSDFTDSAYLMEVPAGPLPQVLVSPTSRLMVKSAQAANLTLLNSTQGCYKMSLSPTDTYSLDHTVCSQLCQWIVPPHNSSGELALHVSAANLTSKDQAKLYRLNDKEPLMLLQEAIREIYIPAQSGFMLEVSRDNCSNGSSLQVTYDIQPACSKNYTIEPTRNLSLTSPNYPDFYPFNADCNTMVSTKGKVLLVTVDCLELAPGHSLTLEESNHTLKLEQPTDVLVEASALWLHLQGHNSKPPLDPAGRTAPGYNLTVTAAECGHEVNASNGSLTSTNASSCIWTVKLPPSTLLNYTLSLPKGGKLELHDGPSLRSPPAPQTNHSLSLTNEMVVVYEKLDAKEPFTLEYVAYECQYYCNNSLCMHPDWKCNDLNDCGDWSDELHCNGTHPKPSPHPRPAPEPAPGWSAGSFAAAIILSFIVGLSLAYAAPILYNRYRMTTYQPFSSSLE